MNLETPKEKKFILLYMLPKVTMHWPLNRSKASWSNF